jgi:hypothetical protein
MRRFIGAAAGLAVMGLLLSGCSKPFYRLKPEAEKYIGSTDIVIGIQQKELDADIEKSKVSSATGGGLIPALIDGMVDNDRAKKAEIRVQPLRDGLVNYDFPTQLSSALQLELVKYPWLHLRQVSIDREIPSGWRGREFAKSKAQAVMLIEASYKLSPKFDSVQCAAGTIMFPKQAPLCNYSEKPKCDSNNPVGNDRAIYRNDRIEASSFVSGISADLTKDSEAERTRQVNLVRDALDKLAKEMAQRIASDLSAR